MHLLIGDALFFRNISVLSKLAEILFIPYNNIKEEFDSYYHSNNGYIFE